MMAEAELTQTIAPPASARAASRWVGQRHSGVVTIFAYAGMILCALVIGLPVYWMIIGAFKNSVEVYRIPPTWIPLEPTVANLHQYHHHNALRQRLRDLLRRQLGICVCVPALSKAGMAFCRPARRADGS
jgi:ABC-type glycerol-3-phosphate transport system permease component